MKQILNTIERRNKTATKYKFQIVPKQLIVETDSKFVPEQIQIVCIHRKKRVSSKPRQLESSCTIDCRHLIVWPDSMAELIEFETTLYREDANNTLADKNWTIVLEGTINKKMKNGKVKLKNRNALASAELNIKSMIGMPGELAEVQICMRPLCDAIKYCQIDFHAYAIEQKQTSVKTSVESTPILAPASVPTSPKTITASNNEWNNSTSRLESNQDPIIPPNRDEIESIPKMVINPPVLPSISFTSTRPADQNHRIVVEVNEEKDHHHGHEESTTIITPNVKKTMEKLPVEEQNDSVLDSKPISNILPNIQSSMPPPASAPARPQIIAANNGWNSPRVMVSNSATRTKPVPPNQAEMEALIAQMIANKRPNLGTTPLTSRTKITQQNKQNGQELVEAKTTIARQSSISNALKERTRKIEEELKQIDEEYARVEEQKMFVQDKLSDSEQNSEQERELMEHKQRLVNEMEQLVRRQHYLNVQLELEEVEFKISHLRSLLASTNSPIEEEGGTNWRINRMDENKNAMLDLKKFMDRKEELTLQLSDMEAEDEEGIERSRLVLETTRKQNFLRGSEDTFNMSKRLMNWLGGMEQRFKQ